MHSPREAASQARGVGADLRMRWLLLAAATAIALVGARARGGAEGSPSARRPSARWAEGSPSARRSFLAPANYLDPFNAADARALAPHYAAFVAEFADEIRSEFAAAEAFAALTKGSSDVVCKGQIGRVEAAMLYVAIRVERPQRVLEVGALCGSSTRWILAALLRNGGVGTLTTFDLHDFAPTFVRPSVETDRWTFVRGDVLAHVREVDAAVATEADLIFVDALHRNAFAREYTRELLGRARRRVLVFAHDIYSPFMIPLYKPCQRSMTEATLDEERRCLTKRAAEFAGAHGTDTFYGPTQAGDSSRR